MIKVLFRGINAALVFLAVGLLFPLGTAENTASGPHAGSAGGGAEHESEGSYEPAADSLPGQEQGSRAEQVMKALAAAYPERIGKAEWRDGDWAVPVLGEWFFYAEGRLLPAALKDAKGTKNIIEEYDPQPFYNYALDLPPWKEPGPEETERFRNFAQRRQENPPKRSQHFYDALWQAHTREEAYERVKTIRFLNRTVLAHYAILEDLALVEARILREAQTDPKLREWIRTIETLSGWNWRSIADTQSRSFHAYGVAIDILPAGRRGLETYWLWTSRNNPQWWAAPYSKRLHPPDSVIKAFEAYGFIWGGKWLFYDTMHFEYRPEIFLLNDLPVNRY
ncbi:MAG: M15 family metallopeptidase [Treponema sp.]|jgi:hypothetical protein|nr:M15 family metallopeptidase [Treponema sp.]